MIEFPDSNKRLYSCFVCGVTFEEYKDMASHVIETHEESREYLICPVKHCGAPVRDLVFHFRNRHPSCKCPKNCQLRATIMYDIKNPKKRKKLPTFKSGYVESKKNNKNMHYRSSYEEQVYNCLENMGEVLSYDVEPFGIPYYYKGKSHKYYPDLKIQMNDGSVVIWEIKPSVQTATKQNSSKFKAAEYFCQLRGWKFEVITEQRIQQLKRTK